MLSPPPRGVTTAICDPHEIANVIGATGIRYFLDCAVQTIMDIRVQLSSCVPAHPSGDRRRPPSTSMTFCPSVIIPR